MKSNSSERYTFQTQMHEVVEVEKNVGTSDHTQLTNLDAPDQHPISAIIGLQEILDELRAGLKPVEPDEPDLIPAIVQPKVALELSGAGAKTCEVGEIVAVGFNAKLEPGSYEYGPETGIVPTAWIVTDTADNMADAAFGSFDVPVAEDTDYKITATATHGNGNVPVTSKGNQYPAGQIAADVKSITLEASFTGYRKSFWGTTTDKGEITSDVIRSLAGSSDAALANDSAFDITIPKGAMRVIIAYPADLQDLSSVKDDNGMSAQIVSAFKPMTVQVEGANGFEAIDYKVYYQNFAIANDTKNTYKVTI